MAAHGVPQRLLPDNGAALNPTRRGFTGQLVDHVSRLGVQAITGKPYKPTTQGENKRFHQTLFRYLDKQPLAQDLAELQTQVDAFDHLYNTQRPHQGLPGRVTPLTAWPATPKADPPRPHFDRPTLSCPTPRLADSSIPPRSASGPRPAPLDLPADLLVDLHADTCVKTLTSAGTFMLDSVHYKIDGQHGFEHVLVTTDRHKIIVTDVRGEVLIEHTRPEPGVKYVGNGAGPTADARSALETSPRS